MLTYAMPLAFKSSLLQKVDLWLTTSNKGTNTACSLTAFPFLLCSNFSLAYSTYNLPLFSVCQTRLSQTSAVPIYYFWNMQFAKLHLAFSGFQISLLKIHLFFGKAQICFSKWEANTWVHSIFFHQAAVQEKTAWLGTTASFCCAWESKDFDHFWFGSCLEYCSNFPPANLAELLSKLFSRANHSKAKWWGKPPVVFLQFLGFNFWTPSMPQTPCQGWRTSVILPK